MITRSTAILASDNIDLTLHYYKEVLGFEATWTWGSPPTFGTATMGGVTVMFSLDADLAKKVNGLSHFFEVDDADAWYGRCLQNGAKIIRQIEDKPWGFREFEVEDPAGYCLRFAGPLSYSPPLASPLGQRVTLERRLPSAEEFVALIEDAFGPGHAFPRFLSPSWGGVTAVLEDGVVCGTVRIVNPSEGWYSIWDVAVSKELQGQGIGRRLVEEAVSMIREDSPGAWVYLFTYKPKFYEKIGFGRETVTMRRV